MVFPIKIFDISEPCGELISKICIDHIFTIGHTDLGSVVYNFARFVAEKKQFHTFDFAHDGAMIESLIGAGWKANIIQRCLFSHNPNPWSECRHHLNV